ncbi:leucine-rich repeat domain-containing protein [Haloimpatiens lingqiaonensis]|uniref:leucine-rich repeat domain-containing protein n=1 Tax=Haloimpatiens lingqiaonensis TaxID=1380675 RepID=UPI0010FD356D|nr:leucine-rich repeat domain-containing protein [Haloimpatiens lingqiaonensis]
MTELEHLKLYNNLIRDISPLKTLTKLNYLDVHFNVDNDGSNGITNADVVKNMPELDTLDLSANHITNVDAIVGLNKLRVLDFSANNVKDYTNIKDKVATMFSKQLDEDNNPEGISCGFFGQKLNVNQKVVIPATGGEFTFNSPYLGLDELAQEFGLDNFFLMCNPLYVINGRFDATEVEELREGDKKAEEMIESIEYNSENKTFTVKVKPNTTTEKKNLKIDVNATTGELGFILTGIEINQETKPEETKPEETKPEETKSEETKPEETQPEETKPQETQPDVKLGATQEAKTVSTVVLGNKKTSNEKISTLPKTGGVSEGMGVLLGSLLSAIGVIMLLSKRRN